MLPFTRDQIAGLRAIVGDELFEMRTTLDMAFATISNGQPFERPSYQVFASEHMQTSFFVLHITATRHKEHYTIEHYIQLNP